MFPNFCFSRMINVTIKKPLSTKNMSTPSQPNLKIFRPLMWSCACSLITAKALRNRRPFKEGKCDDEENCAYAILELSARISNGFIGNLLPQRGERGSHGAGILCEE